MKTTIVCDGPTPEGQCRLGCGTVNSKGCLCRIPIDVREMFVCVDLAVIPWDRPAKYRVPICVPPGHIALWKGGYTEAMNLDGSPL